MPRWVWAAGAAGVLLIGVAALVFALRSGDTTTRVLVVQPAAASTTTSTTTTALAASSTTTTLPAAISCALGRDPFGVCYDAHGVTGPRPPVGTSYDRAWYCHHPPDPDGIDRSGSAYCSGGPATG